MCNLTGTFVVAREGGQAADGEGQGRQDHQYRLADLRTGARHGGCPYTAAKGRHQDADQGDDRPNGRCTGIQANAIGPGFILTEMTQALADDPQFDGWVKSRIPSRRWGLPKDLAGTVVFLASSASDYVNGHVLYVDGGWLSVM